MWLQNPGKDAIGTSRGHAGKVIRGAEIARPNDEGLGAHLQDRLERAQRNETLPFVRCTDQAGVDRGAVDDIVRAEPPGDIPSCVLPAGSCDETPRLPFLEAINLKPCKKREVHRQEDYTSCDAHNSHVSLTA